MPATTTAPSHSTTMIRFMRYVRRYAGIQPRTFWCEFSFYTVITDARQKFLLGNRPQDLAHLETIEKRSWARHQAYIERLENFPIDKAEYYVRLKESYGVNTVRGLAQITGEDWSRIAKTLRTLELPEAIKEYLRNHKTEPEIVKFFTLGRLLDIVHQGEERLQLARFRELVEEHEVALYEGGR